MNIEFGSWATIPVPENLEAVILRPAPPGERYSDDEFSEFCALYPEMRIEMNSEGELIIMPPVASDGGKRNFLLTSRFGTWVEADGTGVGFDSSTGFTLANGAKRSPDASWIRRERWDALSAEDQSTLAPIWPDFVVELRSKSDRLSTLREKMQEYIDNGALLGWLLDPIEQAVHIYRPHTATEILHQPSEISGDPLLAEFRLQLQGILY